MCRWQKKSVTNNFSMTAWPIKDSLTPPNFLPFFFHLENNNKNTIFDRFHTNKKRNWMKVIYFFWLFCCGRYSHIFVQHRTHENDNQKLIRVRYCENKMKRCRMMTLESSVWNVFRWAYMCRFWYAILRRVEYIELYVMESKLVITWNRSIYSSEML